VQAAALTERIHYWTGGQPYLTQLLCSYLGTDATPANVDAGVERLRREDENHLPPMLERLDHDEKLRRYVERVLVGERIKFYPRENRRQAQLELLGVIKENVKGFCIVRNRIYKQVLAGVAGPAVGPSTSTATLHPELNDALTRRTLALFIGTDLPREVTGLPSRADLARELARSKGLNESLSLAEVAQRVGQAGNRWEFTAFVRDSLDTAGKSPQPFHQRIVALVKEHQIETIITTAYDNLLELAFQQAGVGINRVVRGGDVSFINPDRPTLIKLYGDAQQPDTLVVTDRDHSDLLRNRDKEPLLDEVRRALRRNTMLFLGYNLADPDFRFLFDQIAGSRFARTAYGVWPALSEAEGPGLPEADVQMWRDRGIVILDTDPLGILGEAVAQPRSHSRPEATVVVPGEAQRLAWDTATIRQLLTAAFDDEELTTLCFDYFPPVYQDFGSGMSKGQKTQRLLDYCERHDQLETLLGQVKERNPAQYARFAPALRRESSVAASPSQSSKGERARQHRRIDAAAPSHAEVGQQIDVLVQVRFPDSPLLGVEDWPTKRRPLSIEQASEPMTLEFPLDPRTGKLGSAHLEARVVAPDFTIEGAARKLVEVPPDQYSKCIRFLLTAERAGNCRINIEMYNVDDVYLGTIPVEVETAGDGVTTPPTAIVTSLFFVVMVEHGSTVIVGKDLTAQQAKGHHIAQASDGSTAIVGDDSVVVGDEGIAQVVKVKVDGDYVDQRSTTVIVGDGNVVGNHSRSHVVKGRSPVTGGVSESREVGPGRRAIDASSVQPWSYQAGSSVAGVAVSADGSRILAATLGRRVVCLDRGGELLWSAEVGNQAWRVALSADGHMAVAGTGSTRPWDMKGRGVYAFDGDGQLRWRQELGASVWGLHLAAGGRAIAVGTDGHEALLFDGQGQLLWRRKMPGLGWWAWVWAAALSADGQTVAVGAANKTVLVLDRGGNLLGQYRAAADVFAVAVSADGRTVAAGSSDQQAYLLDRQGDLLWREKLDDKVWAVALSADGRRLIVGAGEKEAHVRTFDRGGQSLWKRYVEGSVGSVAVSAGGEVVGVGTRAGHVYIFDGDGEPLHHHVAQKNVRDVVVSSDGQVAAAASEDGQVYGFLLSP